MDWVDLYDKLYELYGECECPLEHATPFQLLAAVMLSAQCRDERVNMVTRELFALAPDPRSMAELGEKKIAETIRPCGLYAVKARNLHSTAVILAEKFGSKLPRDMEQLIQLPGIGRKSANVVLGNAFDIPGFPVDTHVDRLLNRLGMVKSADPVRIEMIVNGKVAPERWTNFSHLLICHGRQVCHARTPECGRCPFESRCPYCKGKKK